MSRDLRAEREALEPADPKNDRIAHRPLGDLIELTLGPEAPRNTQEDPVYRAMHLAGLELKALAIASAHLHDGGADIPSDDNLNHVEFTELLCALASRMTAQAELAKRLCEARWNQDGYPGHVPEGDEDEEPSGVIQ